MVTNDAIEERRAQLKHELSKGQEQLARLDRERDLTQQTLLRIGGAIQVLEEILQQAESELEQAKESGHVKRPSYTQEVDGLQKLAAVD